MPLLSNLDVYMTIAETALAKAQCLDGAGRTPKKNGDLGYVVAWDPERTSFKQSLIAIAFAGMYLEALLYRAGVSRLGKELYLKLDRRKYEDKLAALGLSDPKLFSDCTRFRESRNDLIHEKAVEPHELNASSLRMAQEEAAHAVAFVKATTAALHRMP